MLRKKLFTRLTKAFVFVAALGTAVGIAGTNLAAAAPITYCGSINYDDSIYGATTTAVTYDSGLGKCKIALLPGNEDDQYSFSTYNNLQLPGYVTSINVYGVGGGGSTAMETSNWWDSYYQWNQGNYSYNTIQNTDSGGGGGGGASFSRTGLTVNSSYRFNLSAGYAGMLDSSFTKWLSPDTTPGYKGSNGTDSTFSYTVSGTTTSITAGGGKAPVTYASNGGAGGTVSGTTAGWTTTSGSAGLSRASNNTAAYGGTSIAAISSSNVGQAGGASNGWPGGKGAGRGSGGGGSNIDSGQSNYTDIPCFMSQYRYACDGQPGAIVITYAAVDYVPVYVDYQPSLDVTNPVVGTAINAISTLSIGADVSPAPTRTYAWYRCTAQSLFNSAGNTQATGCTLISGATASTYTPVTADLGYYIQPKITLVNSGTGSTTTLVLYTETTGDKVVTTPSAPSTATTTTSMTPTSAVVSVTPNTTWGAAVWFDVVKASDSTVVGSTSFDSVNNRITITGLTANTAYSLKVRQVNAAGTSPVSSQTLAFTTPLAVTNNSVPTVTTDTRVGKVATYTPVSSWTGNSTPTVSYAWYFCNASTSGIYQSQGTSAALISGCTSFGTATTSTATIPAAALSKYVMVLETATDSFSTSYYRSASTVAITGEMDPVIITTVTKGVDANNVPNATISFNLPAFVGSGSTINNIVYRYSTNGGTTWSGSISSGAYYTQTFTASSLAYGTTYIFQVGVLNNSAYNAWSASSSSLVIPAVISASYVSNFSGAPIVGGSMSVSSSTWTSTPTPTISMYSWYSCSATKTTANAGILSSLTSGCTLNSSGATKTSLNPVPTTFRGQYLMVVFTVSDGYATRYFNNSAVQITGIPGSPTAVTPSVTGTTTASVTFTPSTVVPYSAVTGYKYDYAPGPAYTAWTSAVTTGAGTATTFNVTGLTAGTSYKFRMYAVNADGQSFVSSQSAAITTYALPAISGTPSIVGTPAVGASLMTDESSLVVTGSPAPVLTRSWYACDNTTDAATLTGTCAAISGETTAGLTVSVAQSMKYLVYRVTATNSSGSTSARSATSIQVPGVPGAPTGVTLSAVNTTSIRVDYTLPTDIGGGSITGIEYQYAVSPYSSWSTFAAAPDYSGSFTLTGLSSNTSYKVQVRALNSIGAGAVALSTNAISTLGATVVSVSPTLAGNAYVGQVLTATEPGGMFTGTPTPTIASRAWYSCATSKAAADALSDCSAISGATATTFTVTSAQLGAYIVYAASGTNSSGNATASSASTSIVATVPAAPTINIVSLNGSGSASVTVTLGADNNSPITSIEYELNSSGTWVSTGSTATTFTVGSLTNGTQYSLRVRTSNAAGASAASTSSNVTPIAAPGTVTAVQGDQVIALTWAPITGATGYAVSYSTSAGSGFTSATGSCAAPTGASCSLTGLTVGTAYYYKVFATNANGSSLASTAYGPTTVLQTAGITGTPTLSGTIGVGYFITGVETGLTIVGTAAPTLTRAWYACDSTTDAANLTGSCAVISGATGTTLSTTDAQARKYLVYKVTATNSLGSATARSATSAMVAGVPDTITTFTATAASTTSIAVTFSAPVNNGGSSVNTVQYKYAAAPYSSWSGWTTVAMPVSSFTISGLTGSTSYQVIMRAVNAYGNSVDSAASAAVTTFGGPALVSNPTLAGTAYVGQTLTATEPGGMFSGTPTPTISARAWYACATSKVASANLSDCTAIAGATTTTFALTSAQLGSYIVYATTATNSQGTATASTASSAIVATVPSAPTINIASLAGSGSASIALTLGSANNSAITAIEYELNGSGTWISTGSVSSNFTINALTNGTAYSVRVRTINAAGTSTASAVTSVTTLAAPGAATAVRGDGSLVLSWSAVAGATGYAVSYSTSAGSGFASAPGACASTALLACTVTGLTNSQAYYVKLVATNANGSSPLSVVAGPFTPLSQDTTLASLVLRGKTAANSTAVGVAFGAAFAPGTRAYTAEVAAGVQFVTVTPTRAITGQLIKVNGVTVASAAQSADIAVAFGSNTVTIEVQSVEKVADSSSSATANYVLTISRLAPDMTGFTAFSGGSSNNSSNSNTTVAAPLPSTYSSIGITGVTTNNVAAINTAIASLPATSVDTPAELQAVVTSYVAVLAQASGNAQTAPTAADYTAIGVTAAATFSPAQLTYLNSVIAVQGTAATASIATVQQLATAIANVYAVAAATTNSTVTVDQLTALGITGVTAANLTDVIAAIAATADDGSGINTVAKIQALVNTVKASSVTSIATPSVPPTATTFASAGVTGVTSTNVAAINSLLATLPSTAKDSTIEIQTVVDSYSFIMAQAAGVSLSTLVQAAGSVGASSLTVGPSPANYSAIGANVAAALGTSSLSLLNSLLGNLPATSFDTAAEINTLAAAVSTIQTNAASATVDDFAALGLRGVTPANLAAIRAMIATAPTSAKDSFAEIQALIDSSVTVVAASAFANASVATSVIAPTVQDFILLGVAGVSSSNVSALNTAIRSAAAAANPPGSWIASQSAIQTILDSLRTAQVTAISSYSGTGTAPAVTDYQVLGVIGVKPANIAAINEFVAALPSTATDSPAEVQAVVNAYSAVLATATTGKPTQLTLANLQSLGVTGVTSTNFAAVAAAIAAAASTAVDSQAELQALVTAAVAGASTSTTTIVSYASNPASAPSLQVYAAAGVIGVTTANKALIDQALAVANPAPSTLADIQAIVASVTSATVAQIASPTAVTSLRTNDFAVAGVVGVTNTNRAAVVAVLAQLPAAARDSVVEIQAVVDSYSLIASVALGGSNLAADAPKPTVADFAAIGVDLGVIATDPEAFAFFVKVLAKLPADVVSSPEALTDRAFVVANLLRAASNKPTVGTLTATDLNSIGFAAVTSSNVTSVLTEISTGSNGVAGLDSIEAAAVKYAVIVAAPAGPTPTPTPTTPNVDPTPTPTPTPTPEVVPVPAPKTVGFAAGSTVLTPAAKGVVVNQVTKLIQAKAKTVVIRSVATLPKNSSTTWTAQVLAAAKARATAVASVVAAKVKALRANAKVIIRVSTTTVDNTRVVKISGTK